MSGIRLVKSFGGEEYEEARFREASNRYARGMRRVTRLSQLALPITETVGTAVAVIILWFGAREVLEGGGLDGQTLIGFLALDAAHPAATQAALAGADGRRAVDGGRRARVRRAGRRVGVRS